MTRRPQEETVIPIRTGPARGFAAADLSGPLARLSGPLEPASASAVLKQSRHTLVFTAPLGGRTVVVKRQGPRRFWRRLLAPLRASRATRGFAMSRALRRARVRVPRPLAALETRRWGWPARSDLLCEHVANAATLHAFLAATPAGDPRRVAVARRLGRLIGRVHAAGFRHRDLKAPNFLVGPGLRVWLVDLDGLGRAPAARVRARRGRDLARLLRDVEETGGLVRAEARVFARAYARGRRPRPRPITPSS